MGETGKAWVRFATDPLWREVPERVDGGQAWLDVGRGDDRLPGAMHSGLDSNGVLYVDPHLLDGHRDGSYDLVYSNFLLQTLAAPRQALQRWVEVTRPGGFIWVIVPDFWLYEHGQWPSIFDTDHKHVFLCRRGKGVLPAKAPIIYLDELARSVENEVQVRRIKRQDTGYDFKRLRELTAQPNAEASCEMVLQKI